MKPLSPSTVHARLRQKISEYGSQAAAARAWGIDTGQLSRILNGKTTIPQHVLDHVDIERTTVVRYVYQDKK